LDIDLAVIALVVDSQKTFLNLGLAVAWLLTRIAMAIVNPWWRVGVSKICGSNKYIGGQFRENVLGFRLHNSSGISIALSTC
jgi:hypothetical protein